jgi:DNA modification methylase
VKPYFETDNATIYHGDNIATMQAVIPDASIDLVVTSPPYDNLRTYGGHSWDFEGLAAELWRAIKPGGVVVWVVSDATIDGSETGTSFRQAMHFKDLGFRLHDTMIWKKATPLPIISNRYNPEFEYCFVLSKNKPRVFNPIFVPCATAGAMRKNLNGKHGGGGRAKDAFAGKIRLTKDQKVKGNVWDFATGTAAGDDLMASAHPATFPESLARDHILSWSNEGDTVLDPFSGSGTTAKMARLMGRRAIGIEVNQEYCDIAVERLRQRVLF